MLNQVQAGDAIYVVAANSGQLPTGAFVSGNGYLVGSMFGVAGFSCAVGATGVLWTVGVFTLPKITGTAWLAGQRLTWDTAVNKCSTVVGTLLTIGYATDPALSAAAVGNVRLSGAVATAAA